MLRVRQPLIKGNVSAPIWYRYIDARRDKVRKLRAKRDCILREERKESLSVSKKLPS